MKPNNISSQVTAFQEAVVLTLGWQQGKVAELDNEENKQFDSGG